MRLVQKRDIANLKLDLAQVLQTWSRQISAQPFMWQHSSIFNNSIFISENKPQQKIKHQAGYEIRFHKHFNYAQTRCQSEPKKAPYYLQFQYVFIIFSFRLRFRTGFTHITTTWH